MSAPVSTGMGDHVRGQFPVRDIILSMWQATQVNLAWPSLRAQAQWVPAKGGSDT